MHAIRLKMRVKVSIEHPCPLPVAVPVWKVGKHMHIS
jgi:hypothetical protein